MKTPRQMLEKFTFADEWIDPVEQAVIRRDEQWRRDLINAVESAERLAHAFQLPAMCPSELCAFDDEGQCVAWRFHEHARKQIAEHSASPPPTLIRKRRVSP